MIKKMVGRIPKYDPRNRILPDLKCNLLIKNNMMHKELKERLLELSDINLQRKLWLNIDNNTGLISSYSELFNSLLGDFNFDYEVKNLDDNNLKQNFLKLKVMLEEYKELSSYMDNYDDNIIINDSNWKNIVFFAKSLPLAVIKTSE
ncbi:hypothetical protein D1631_17290 [Chryseobacterium nematophagum]|uniref:Uncharacterized protein n=2 Tax=Chryseobacterium nematophagum TaxID=2305228 RepID=A0A3M7TJ15_9FLAO|nr:hypothetical protein D1631_17290 [Chryseobacterium nematophagum]